MTPGSLLDEHSCRGKDALRIWEHVQTGRWTIREVADRIGRGVAYTHDLLRTPQCEKKVHLVRARRVSDTSIQLHPECDQEDLT